MIIDSGSYLGADRSNPESFFGAIGSDFQKIGAQHAIGEPIKAVDAQITTLAGMDANMALALNTLAIGDPIPRDWRKTARMAVRETLSTVWTGAERNYLVTSEIDESIFLEDISDFSLERHESDLQPGWNATVLEHWTRLGTRNAFIPLMWSLFASKFGRPYKGPDISLLDDALIKTACISEFLDKVYAHNLQANISKADHARIYDQRAMLLEYEAVIHLYENGIRDGSGKLLWIFPSPPAIDFGKGDAEGRKIDIVGTIFENGIPTNGIGFDVKRKHRTQQQHAKKGIFLLSALDIGCEVYRSGRNVFDYSAVSRGYIESYTTVNPYSRYTDPRFRTAMALAILGVPIKKIDTTTPMCLT